MSRLDTLDRRSLWIGLGIGAIYLIFGLWRTIIFLVLVALGYVISHPLVRERILIPLWIGVLTQVDRWRGK